MSDTEPSHSDYDEDEFDYENENQLNKTIITVDECDFGSIEDEDSIGTRNFIGKCLTSDNIAMMSNRLNSDCVGNASEIAVHAIFKSCNDFDFRENLQVVSCFILFLLLLLL